MKAFGMCWVAAAALCACAHGPGQPQSVAELHQQADWQFDAGSALLESMRADVSRLARKNGRAATLTQLGEAGYECQFGEAHEDYPEPMAVCTKSFATRACQFDWEVTLTSDPARPDGVETTDTAFTRDCVATADDWPVPFNSAIDDQLAPPPNIADTYSNH